MASPKVFPERTVEVEASEIAPGDDVEFLAIKLSALDDRGTDRGLVDVGALDVPRHLDGVGQLVSPVQPVGAGDDPDLVQQLHRLGLHVQIVQVQGGKLQLQVVKLKVRQILPGLLQQHLGVAHIVPVHRLRDPAMPRHCLVGLDVQASAVHALHRQIGV